MAKYLVKEIHIWFRYTSLFILVKSSVIIGISFIYLLWVWVLDILFVGSCLSYTHMDRSVSYTATMSIFTLFMVRQRGFKPIFEVQQPHNRFSLDTNTLQSIPNNNDEMSLYYRWKNEVVHICQDAVGFRWPMIPNNILHHKRMPTGSGSPSFALVNGGRWIPRDSFWIIMLLNFKDMPMT